MSTEEDNFTLRSIKGEIAAWAARAEKATQLGNTQLLQKALKHKTKYENQLANLHRILAEAEERDRLRMLDPDQPEEHGCGWCSIFETTEMWMYDELVSFDGSSDLSELMRKTVSTMGLTIAEAQSMEANFAAFINESSPCNECRIVQNKMLTVLRLMRESVQTET